MSDVVFIGIDPGVGGGAAALVSGAGVTLKFKDATERDIQIWFGAFLYHNPFAIIEKVASTPQMGVCSAFTFGRSYGFLRGILIGLNIAFEEVSPQKWQKELNCRTKGDKNISKARAQQLFPGEKVTHATGDALCLAEYARRIYHLRRGLSS